MKRIKLDRFSKLCTMLAVASILLGLHASSIYGQETSTRDDAAQANAGPPNAQCGVTCNATKGFAIGGKIVLQVAGGTSATNTAIGNGALAANTTGTLNTTGGDSALISNTAGTGNTAFGRGAFCSQNSMMRTWGPAKKANHRTTQQ